MIVQKIKSLNKNLILAIAVSPIIYATIPSFHIDFKNNFDKPSSVVAAQVTSSTPIPSIQNELSNNSENQLEFINGAYPILLGFLGMGLVSTLQTVLSMLVSYREQSRELKKIDKQIEKMRIPIEHKKTSLQRQVRTSRRNNEKL
jgi:hypothetical protein